MQVQAQGWTLVVCIRNAEYPAALECRKIYRVLPDDAAATHQLLRVVDESGEDYLYPARYFLPVQVPPHVQEAISSP